MSHSKFFSIVNEESHSCNTKNTKEMTSDSQSIVSKQDTK